MKTKFEQYLELSDYGKMQLLEQLIKELNMALKDSTRLLEELEGTEADEEGQIKCQVHINNAWIRQVPL